MLTKAALIKIKETRGPIELKVKTSKLETGKNTGLITVRQWVDIKWRKATAKLRSLVTED